MRGIEALIAVTAVIGLAGCHIEQEQQVEPEQQAFDHFMANEWGPQLFDGECTGLLFDPSEPLRVLIDKPGFSIGVPDFAALAGIDLKAAVLEPGGLERISALGKDERADFSVDVSKFPLAEPVDSTAPKRDWKSQDGYLLRFSNRVRLRELTYLQIWVKAGWSSSGTRINYEFDQAGILRRAEARGSICDDWG